MRTHKEILNDLLIVAKDIRTALGSGVDLHTDLDALIDEANEVLREPDDNDRDSSEERERIFFCDIMDTALCGGIHYWARVRKLAKVLDEHTHRTVSFEVKPDEPAFPEGDPRDKWQTITPSVINLALQTIRNSETRHVSDDRRATILLAWNDLDAGMIDADLADCIVQIAAFGELVFS